MTRRPFGLDETSESLFGKRFCDLSDAELDAVVRTAHELGLQMKGAQNKKKRLLWELGIKPRCSRCGYSASLAALHFHHRDRSKKEGHVGDLPIAQAKAEALKCDLVCANCHAEIHDGAPA